MTLSAPAHPGDALTMYAVGLGPTNPATPTGVPATVNPVATMPTLSIGGVTVTPSSVGLTLPGIYQVNFTVPTSGVQGSEPIVIATGGQNSTNWVTLPLAGLTSVVVNGSFANPGTISPGSIASVFANGLGTASTNETTGLFPSTLSEGVEVTFNGEAAPMFHLIPAASPQQIDLYIPTDLPTSGTVNVQLTTSSSLYPNYTLKLVPAIPSFFRFTDPKTTTQYLIAQFANSAWVVLPTTAAKNIGFPACTATTPLTTECGEPAAIGDTIAIYLTGLGLATPNGDPNGKPLQTGTNPPADGSVLYETPALPTVTVGGVSAKVLFSGLTPGFAGEYQIDVQIPTGVANGDSVPVVVSMNGVSDTTNISIQQSRIAPPGQ